MSVRGSSGRFGRAVLAVALLAPLVPVAALAGPTPAPAHHACVGDPPRQTFDPHSPPCVPFFDGENPGATAPGVSAHEVRLLAVVPGAISYSRASDPANRASPRSGVFDTGWSDEECAEHHTPRTCSHFIMEGLRSWQQYFDQAFQSYGRTIRLWVQFVHPETHPLAAQLLWEEARAAVDPFAVVSLAGASGFPVPGYVDAVVADGVPVFTADEITSDAALDAAEHLWSWAPSADVLAANLASQVCAQVVNHPVSGRRVGPGPAVGALEPRTLGLVHTTSPDHPELVAAAEIVRSGVEACGGSFAAVATYRSCCAVHDGSDLPHDEMAAMAAMRAAGVTTVIWPGGVNGSLVRAAAALGYTPEWVMLGLGELDSDHAVRLAGSPVLHDRAGVLTPRVPLVAGSTPPCEQAFRQVDTQLTDGELHHVCPQYRPLFLAAMAIQVAGPDLTVASVRAGLEAIPARAGASDREATSFTPTDHSYVDDAVVEWWDATGSTAAERPGCWRVSRGGQRSAAGGWAPHSWGSDRAPHDQCDLTLGSARVELT